VTLYGSPATLLEHLKGGQEEARQLFWKRSWDDVYAVALNILENSPDATELAVDVLSDFLFDYVHKITCANSVQSYLRVVTMRRSLRFLKKKRASSSRGLEELVDIDSKSPEESAYYAGLLPKLNQCMDQLTPKAQRVLRLRYQSEFTNESIGSLVGGSKQYIGRLITRSISLLRDCLKSRSATDTKEANRGLT
jgi:RNA polymerase sigma factor (sigma-70 family)